MAYVKCLSGRAVAVVAEEAEPKNHQTKLCATAINLRHECAYRVHFTNLLT